MMPLQSHLPTALSTLKVTEDELVELARRGRVQFVLPQSIDRYPIPFLDRLADVAPSALLFSRRLASATIADGRRRIPFLYPPFSASGRRFLLEIMARAQRDTVLTGFTQAISTELGRIWSSVEELVNVRGAMATPALGLGPIVASTYQYITKRDLTLELMMATGFVEWGGALKATVFPVQTDGYTDQAAVELCASAYSGIRNEPVPTSFGAVETILDGLLVIDNDAPILEFADVFTNSDIDRLAVLVGRIGEQNIDPGSIAVAIGEMNDKVRTYEKRTERLKRLNVVGLGGIFAGVLFTGHPGAAIIPLGAWLAQYLFKDADPSHDLGGRVLDWVRGANAWTTEDVVLVSRLRQKV